MARRVGAAVLVIRRDGREVGRFPVGTRQSVIGRSKNATIRIDDTTISSLHASVTCGPRGGVRIRDLGSRNGTFVNGRRITPGEEYVGLKIGDEIQIGRSAILLTEAGEAPRERVPPVALPVPGDDMEPGDEPPTVGDFGATVAAPRARAAAVPAPPADLFDTSRVVLCLDAVDTWAASHAPQDQLLALLWRAGDALNKLADPRAIIQSVRQLLEQALAPARVLVVEPAANGWRPSAPDGPRPASMTVVEYALESRSALLVHDAPSDERVAEAESVRVGGILSAIAAPLLGGRTAAVLYADRHRGERFTERNLGLVGVIASHASAALDNAYHLAELTAARDALAALNRDLERRVEERTAEVRRQAGEIARLAAEKDELLGMAAHDIRSPLSGVLGILELLKADCPATGAGAQMRSDLKLIDDAVRKVLSLVSDLLDVKKIEAGKVTIEREPVEARAFLEGTVAIAAHVAGHKGVELSIRCDEGLLLRIDARRLGQVVQNLVTNAIKFTPKGGSVAVTARAVAGGVEMAVDDTGPGIAPEEAARLFRPFEQGAEGRMTRGSFGLGLAIARKLVELHGGRIWVESVPGKGSRFAFFVPS